MSDSLRPYGLYPARLLCPRDSPGKNTGVGCHSLLQGISLQGLNLGLLHCRQILYHLSHKGRLDLSYQSKDTQWLARYMLPPGDWSQLSGQTQAHSGRMEDDAEHRAAKT